MIYTFTLGNRAIRITGNRADVEAVRELFNEPGPLVPDALDLLKSDEETYNDPDHGEQNDSPHVR